MQRDQRDEWPDDIPIGTFDIEPTTIADYPGVTARMIFVCPKGRRCGVLLAPQPIPRATPYRLYIWGWDGNVDRPTLTPSINCETKTRPDGTPGGGCGWHGHITGGAFA